MTCDVIRRAAIVSTASVMGLPLFLEQRPSDIFICCSVAIYSYYIVLYVLYLGAWGSVVVKALRY